MSCVALPLSSLQARADTLEGALVQAYRNNPTLNSQRASLRATDENVPQALSGYRPRISVTASGGEQSLGSTTKVNTTDAGDLFQPERLQLAGQRRRHRHADAVQRFPDRQQDPPGRSAGLGRARDACA